MFRSLNPQMRFVFNVAALGTTAGITWFLHFRGVIGGAFSWPATITWLAFLCFILVGLRLFVQQAETPSDLFRLFSRRR